MKDFKNKPYRVQTARLSLIVEFLLFCFFNYDSYHGFIMKKKTTKRCGKDQEVHAGIKM